MASRKKLKKTIQFVSSELITNVYFRCLMSKDIDVEKVDKIILEITAQNRAFILRVNCPDGKNNPQLVKAYFRKLFSDWQKSMDTIISQVESL